MMTSTQQGEESSLQFDKYFYSERIHQLIRPSQRRFQRQLKLFLLFNAAFLSLLAIEFVAFWLFFAVLVTSSVLAYSLAVIFFTLFSYFILRLYLKAVTPERLIEVRDEYIRGCKEFLGYQEEVPEHHLALANALEKFSSELQDIEYSFYRLPSWCQPIAPLVERMSCWCHWNDVQRMRELLLLASVEEHIRLVKLEPINLEVHAALANAYVLLSTLYADPDKMEGFDDERWIPPERYSEEMQNKFRLTAERAIEEFKILNDYAPDDPWVHAQLAYSYHDLKMPEEEMREYETILKLRPGDKETLFKLGMLYFQQGHNAKGLKVYEELKRGHYKRAESLIKFYGAFTPYESSGDYITK